MSRSQRDSRPPNSYSSRRYPDPRDPRDPRDYEDKREKMERMYDDRQDRLLPQSISQQTPQGAYRYEMRRAQSSSFNDRFSRSPRKYNNEQMDRDTSYRSPDSQGKRDRSPSEYISEIDKISDIIKKEYQVNPPIQLNIAPTLHYPKPWD